MGVVLKVRFLKFNFKQHTDRPISKFISKLSLNLSKEHYVRQGDIKQLRRDDIKQLIIFLKLIFQN